MTLNELLQAYPQLELVGEGQCANAQLVAVKQPDLLLLHVDLGGATAFDLLAEFGVCAKNHFDHRLCRTCLTQPLIIPRSTTYYCQ